MYFRGVEHAFDRFIAALIADVFYGGFFVKDVGFAFDNLERTGRAGADAITEPIAEVFLHEFGFSVHQLQGALGTADDAVAATVAEIFVDFDNLTFHRVLLFVNCWTHYALTCRWVP